MGLPHKQLYATNTGDESGKILLTAWIPEKREDGRYYWPKDTPLGGDLWCSNMFGLREDEGTVMVSIEKADGETGLWLACEDGYFKDEQWLYNYRPRYLKDKPNKIDEHWCMENVVDDDVFGIHVSTGIDMVAGNGPYPVKLVRKDNVNREKN